MNLYEQTKALWDKDSAKLSSTWAKAIEEGIPALERVGKKFNEPSGLRFYAATGRAAKGGAGRKLPPVRFSLRFHGQEVAEVVVGATPVVSVKAKHKKANWDYFKCETDVGEFEWASSEGGAFRRKFRESDAIPTPDTGPRSPEHDIESRILVEMEKTSKKSKFAGTYAGVRHAGLTKYDYPFQCPVPVSANTGTPKKSVGHIDIVARRRPKGKGVRLSIWELKKPRTYAHAVQQAYIYAVAMALMVKGPGGDVWYRNFKFGSPVPEDLNIEAVIAVTKDQRGKVERDFKKLVLENPLKLKDERTTISLHAALYDEHSLAIEWVDL